MLADSCIIGDIRDSNTTTTQGRKAMKSQVNLFYVSDLSDANRVAATYRAMGYTVAINQNAAAWIDSPVRTDNLFIVAVSK